MNTKEEVKQTLIETILNKRNYNREIEINEGLPFKIQLALACDKKNDGYFDQLATFNGVDQSLSRGHLTFVDFLAHKIELYL